MAQTIALSSAFEQEGVRSGDTGRVSTVTYALRGAS